MRCVRLHLAIVTLLGCLAAACQRSPEVSYQIEIPEGRPDSLRVTLEVRGAGRGPLTLRGYASKEVLRVSDLEAAGADGSPIGVEAGLDAVRVSSAVVDVPKFTLAGPLPSPLHVRYLVRPGNREGDSHMGYTGRSYGYEGPEFAFVTGRNLFLVPQPAEDLRSIRVRFSLPEGWSAVTPWTPEADAWRAGVAGAPAAEHLVTAALGLGRFRERTFESRGTRFRLAFEAALPADAEARTADLLERAARTVTDLFGRGLGPEYLTVVVPKAPHGDEILGEGWATGQGATLAPATGNRLHGFAERLIEAYVRHAPYRSEIRRSEEFWLVDAIKNRYSWLAVARAGLVGEDEVERDLASDMITALGVHGVERDLEKLYSASGSQRTVRETIAPFTLLYLDRELRSGTGGAHSLDSVIPRMFAGARAGSLWSLLPTFRAGFWDDFRARFVKGKEVPPLRQFYALSPVQPSPDPPAGVPARKATLVYTGVTTAYLENCGCKTNQSGGVARRATVLERIRQRDPHAIVLDAGDAFVRPKNQADLDFLTRQEQSLYLRTLDFMRYDAVAVGSTELTFGPERFREQTRGMATPYLASNVRHAGAPIARPSLRLAAGGLRVAVIGVFEPPRGRDATALFEEHTLPLEFDDPVETLRREVPALARQADLVIAIGRLTPFTIRRVARACPDLDVIVSTEYNAPTPAEGPSDEHLHQEDAEGPSESHLHQEDPEGFVDRTLVLYTHLTSYGLGSVELGIDREGRIATAELSDHWLNEAVSDHRAVRDILNRFYDRVGRQAAAQESVGPLFADDPVRVSGRYVGGAVCASCHEAQHQQWMTTKHASAYKTLLDRHRHFQPKCISCHVVGYGTPHGYRLGMPEQTLANVQCEVCHGPGAAHTESPSAANIQRLVPERICLECHNPEHSDHFVYAERVPQVRHDYYEEGFAPAPAAARGDAEPADRGGGR